ncbi:MAG: hypothetical protein QMC62_04175 [Alteromonadaceae bacterium]
MTIRNENFKDIVVLCHPWHHDIAYMDIGTYDLSGTKIMTVHPEHKSLNFQKS